MNIISWEQYDRDIRALAKKLKGEKFDGIYGFPRGGLVIAIHLSHLLSIPYIDDVDLHKEYSLEEQRILYVDDVSDTGRTFIRSEADEKDCAALYIKNHTAFIPKFYVKEINDWIQYPWEK